MSAAAKSKVTTAQQFEAVSEFVEFFLVAFGDIERIDSWLPRLAIFGPSAETVFDEVQDRIIQTSASIAQLNPWKRYPQRYTISSATAHQCASAFMHLVYTLLFKTNRPQHKDGPRLVQWMKRHKSAFEPKIKRLDAKVDYMELVELSAQLRRERICTLSAWGKPTHNGSTHGKTNGMPKKMREVVSRLNNGESSGQIVDAELTNHVRNVRKMKSRALANYPQIMMSEFPNVRRDKM